MMDPYKLYYAACRKGGNYIASRLANSRITPNTVSILDFFAFIPLSAFLFSFGNYVATLVALILLYVYSFFDFVDGALARLKSMATPGGKWLDGTLDMIGCSLVLMSMTVGIFKSNNISFFGFYSVETPLLIMLVIGLFALFAQLMCSLLTNELEHEYKFWTGASRIRGKITSSTHASKLDKLIINIILPFSWPWIIVFGYGWLITLGALLNLTFVSLLIIAVAHSIRAILLFYAFIGSQTGKPRILAIEVIRESSLS